jgi:hypothetical protein
VSLLGGGKKPVLAQCASGPGQPTQTAA